MSFTNWCLLKKEIHFLLLERELIKDNLNFLKQMSENTLENRLQSLNQALSQMMRNTSEREIIDQLTTYKIAIQNTLKILTKKQKQSISMSAREYEDELEKGNL